MPVRAKLVADDESHSGSQPGSFSYYSDSNRPYAGIIARCPCGCGALMGLPLRPVSSGERASWEGPGPDPAHPTLSPSVNSPRERGLCGWHGWLRGGVWYSVDETLPAEGAQL